VSNGSPVSTSDKYPFPFSSDSALCNEDKLAHIFYKAHKSLPLIEVNILDKTLLFLIDTGATFSLIRRTEFKQPVSLSGKTTFSRSASSHVVTESFSTPLECSIDGRKFEHCFLITQTCPVNLMGRDLLCKLGVSVHCTAEGISADMRTMYETTGENPLFVYEWQVSNTCLTTLLMTEC